MQLVKVGDASCDGFKELLICLNKIFLLIAGTVKQKQLEVRLSIATLGGFSEESFSFVVVLGDAETFHVENTHPVLTNETILLSTHGVMACRFFFVSILLRLCVSELRDSVASSAVLARSSLDDCLKGFPNLFEVGVAGKTDVVVNFVLNGGDVAIFGGGLDPVASLGLVDCYFVGVASFN